MPPHTIFWQNFGAKVIVMVLSRNTTELRARQVKPIIYQSIKMYIHVSPLKNPYSEALPTKTKRNRTVFKNW